MDTMAWTKTDVVHGNGKMRPPIGMHQVSVKLREAR